MAATSSSVLLSLRRYATSPAITLRNHVMHRQYKNRASHRQGVSQLSWYLFSTGCNYSIYACKRIVSH